MPPEYTEILNLAKPDLDDQYNVRIWNDNMQKIDNFAGRIPPRAYTADRLRTGAKINGVLFKGDTDVVTGWGWYYSTVNYAKNNIVFTVIGNEVKVKRSLQDENMGHSLSDTNWWGDVELGGNQDTTRFEDVGTIKFSLSPLNNDMLHILDGSLITEIPVDFLDYITWLKNNAPDCIISEADYQNQLSLYGECGNFVYDTDYNTIRLPKVTGIIQGTNTLNQLGKIIQAGLPSISHTHTRGNMNITGTFSGVGQAYYTSRNIAATLSGAFYRVNNSNNPTDGVKIDNSEAAERDDVFGFNAASSWTGSTSVNSNVNSIYGRSNTVQPQTVRGFYYIVYTNLGINQNTFIEIIENKADKTYVDNQLAIADQTYAKKDDIAKVYDFKGNVATYSNLPDIDYEKVGNVYNVLDTGKNYAVATDNLDVKFWDDIGGDLTNYYTKNQTYSASEIDAKLLEIETGQTDVTGQIASIVNGKFEFTTNLNTSVSVMCSNLNLVVTSTYTGHQSQEGTLKYEFIYDGTNWLINEQIADLEVYDLVVIGTPIENDTITLTYLTLKKTIVSVDSTNTYSSTGTKPITGSGVAAALSTIEIPETDQIYDPTSINAQSGTAIANAGFLTIQDITNKADNSIQTLQDIVILSSGSITINSTKSIYSLTPSSAVTFSFTVPSSTIGTNQALTIEVFLDLSGGARSLTFPASVSWQDGQTPDLSATGKYFLVFRTMDGGSTWLGNLQGKW